MDLRPPISRLRWPEFAGGAMGAGDAFGQLCDCSSGTVCLNAPGTPARRTVKRERTDTQTVRITHVPEVFRYREFGNLNGFGGIMEICNSGPMDATTIFQFIGGQEVTVAA